MVRLATNLSDANVAIRPGELIGFVRERLAHFKAPRGVTFTDELPKTATGKIQKFVLRGGEPLPSVTRYVDWWGRSTVPAT
jgi:fatty-acyl-CoA synthase